MACVLRVGLLVGGLLSLTLACAEREVYPPALPAPRVLWDNAEPFIPTTPPPPELRAIVEPPKLPPGIPSAEDWQTLERQAPVRCRGRGKQRRCVPQHETNAATPAPGKQAPLMSGSNGMVRFRYQEGALYTIPTSPFAATFLFLPPGERLAAQIPLNTDEKSPRAWVYDLAEQRKGSPERQEVVAVRPLADPDGTFKPFETVTGLLFRSGLNLFVRLVAREAPGLISVAWDLPVASAPKAPEVPIAQRPPKIDLSRLYTQYRIEPQGKTVPPWVPVSAFDDGTRTFVKFAEPLTYTRGPGIFGLTATGGTALVQSHMYSVAGQHEKGAWMVVQGLWPALELKDSAGLAVRIVRQAQGPVAMQEVPHAVQPTPVVSRGPEPLALDSALH
jgi:type IV secretion system protein TrbG